MIRILTLVRVAAGLVSLALAAWWAARAAWLWWITRPIHDLEFGLRLSPLSPIERADALERERRPDVAATAIRG